MENELILVDRALNLDGFAEEVWTQLLDSFDKFIHPWVKRLPPSILLMAKGSEKSRIHFKKMGLYVNEDLPTPDLVTNLMLKRSEKSPAEIFKSYTLEEKNAVCKFFLEANILQPWVR